jgi:transposase
MHVKEHESLEELVKLTSQQKRVREHQRFRAVVLAREGKGAPEIADTLDCGVRPVQRWIERYNKAGPQGLMEAKGRGRKPRLAAGQEQKLRERLNAGPMPTDPTCAFHGKDIQTILEKEFGVLLKLAGVYCLLHRLGYSRLCPRPRHPDADPAAAEAFKKTRQNKCKRWPRLTPASGWRSGSKTRPASVSKGRSREYGLP